MAQFFFSVLRSVYNPTFHGIKHCNGNVCSRFSGVEGEKALENYIRMMKKSLPAPLPMNGLHVKSFRIKKAEQRRARRDYNCFGVKERRSLVV
jgi:hypothetical protein